MTTEISNRLGKFSKAFFANKSLLSDHNLFLLLKNNTYTTSVRLCSHMLVILGHYGLQTPNIWKEQREKFGDQSYSIMEKLRISSVISSIKEQVLKLEEIMKKLRSDRPAKMLFDWKPHKYRTSRGPCNRLFQTAKIKKQLQLPVRCSDRIMKLAKPNYVE
uniref:Uncharacterized protein n=1 Tax=Rhabditophanes sp. KR3021 TaxID=114890 RepID=A0AC35U5Z1_9BILA